MALADFRHPYKGGMIYFSEINQSRFFDSLLIHVAKYNSEDS